MCFGDVVRVFVCWVDGRIAPAVAKHDAWVAWSRGDGDTPRVDGAGGAGAAGEMSEVELDARAALLEAGNAVLRASVRTARVHVDVLSALAAPLQCEDCGMDLGLAPDALWGPVQRLLEAGELKEGDAFDIDEISAQLPDRYRYCRDCSGDFPAPQPVPAPAPSVGKSERADDVDQGGGSSSLPLPLLRASRAAFARLRLYPGVDELEGADAALALRAVLREALLRETMAGAAASGEAAEVAAGATDMAAAEVEAAAMAEGGGPAFEGARMVTFAAFEKVLLPLWRKLQRCGAAAQSAGGVEGQPLEGGQEEEEEVAGAGDSSGDGAGGTGEEGAGRLDKATV